MGASVWVCVCVGVCGCIYEGVSVWVCGCICEGVSVWVCWCVCEGCICGFLEYLYI